MKTLIISDIHLTHRFDEEKFLFLEKLFSEHDSIILNGDFWDGFSTTFDRFISSQWNKLFPLLIKKNTVYIFGNHDPKKYVDERASLFSISQKDSHILQTESDIYHVEHGHLLEPGIDGVVPLSRSLLKYINFTTHLIENILVRLGSPQNILMKQANKAIKKKLKKKQFPHWYLCGHTHIAEFDNGNKFANSGFVQYGKATYLVVDDSSAPILKREWYK